MEVPATLSFAVHAAEEGGYWAEAAECDIVTQGDSLDELRAMVEDAIAAYFFDSADKPRSFALVFAEAPEPVEV